MSLIWTANPASVAGQNAVAGGPGMLVTVSESDDLARLSLDDGATWTPYALPALGGGWVTVLYSWELGLFAAFSYSGSGDQYATSPDGEVWTVRTFPAATFGNIKFAEGDGYLALFGVSATTIYYTTDLINWSTSTTGATSNAGITFGNGLFLVTSGSNVLSGNSGYYTAGTPAGPWTGREFPDDFPCSVATYGNGVFLVRHVSTVTLLLRSVTGISGWANQAVPAVSDLTFANGTAFPIFIARLAESPYALRWSQTGLTDSWQSLLTANEPSAVGWNEDVAYALIYSNDDLLTELVAPPIPVQVIDSVAMSGPALHHPVKVQRDRIALGDDPRRLYTAVMRSIAALGDAQAIGFEGGKSASDTVSFGSRVTYIVRLLVEEGLVLGDSVVPTYRLVARAVSRILMEGLATGIAEAVVQITDALVLSAVVAAVQKGDVTDSVAMRGLVQSLYQAIGRVIENLLMSDSPSGVFMAVALARDSVVAGSEAGHAADLIAAVRDGVGFATTVQIDNFEYIAWVMNTRTKGTWRYTDYPFNSFAKIGGRYYGAASDGIHDLEADDDNGDPIEWKLRLGMSAMGTRKLKRYPEAFIAVRNDGEMFLKVVVTDEVSGDKHACIYRMAPRNSPERRQKIGRGLKSVEWDWELSGAGTVDLTALQFHPLNLDRRTRG